MIRSRHPLARSAWLTIFPLMLAMLVIIPRPATGAALVIDRQSITNVAFFQERSALQASQVLPLDVHGLVTFVDAKRNLLVLQDGARATAFHVEGSLGNVQPGQRIQIEAARCSFYNPAFPEFPLEPSGSVWLPTLSSPTNHDNYYLSRMHGYLIPPTTGDYTFWIASKSSSDLWLSTNADADGLRRLAFVPAGHATLPEEWDKYSTQSNGPIRLEAGRPYLFDVLQEHRAGRDDTVAVAWQGPGLARTVVEGRFLAPYSNRNTNGVVWEYWDNYFLDSLEPLTAGAMASEVEVKDPKIRILGDRQFPEPIAISIGAELSPDEDFRWAEVQGTVEFAARGADALVLQLEEEHARLTLKLPPNAKLDVAKLAGAQVRARGVCEPVLAENGKRIASVILVPSEKEITRVGVDTAILGKLKPVSEGDIVPENPRLASGRRIRVRGKVLQRDGDRLVIQGPARLSGFISTNGTEWIVAGPAVDLQLHEAALAGLLASSFDSGKLTAAQFGPVTGVDALAQTEEIAGAMPAGRDLAHPEGTFDVIGGGTGFGTGFERLHYFCEPLEKRTEIVARLTGLEAGDAGSTAGIMVRDALDPRSSFAALTWGRDNKVTFRFRQGPRERSEATNCISCPLPCWLKLSRTDPTLEVRVGDGFAARVGDTVDLVGYLGWDGCRPFLSDACRIDRVPSPNFLVSSNAVLSDGAMDSPVRSSLARLVPERGEGLREGAGSVLVRGVVTFAGDAFGRHYLVIQDDTAGAALNLTRRFQRREPGVGQLVELELDNRNGKWPFPLVPIEMRVLGRARAPEPVTLATANTMLRQGEYRWVECKGIVRAAGPGRQLELDSPAGLMAISIGGEGETNLAGYVDALVRLRGVLLQRDGKAALLTPSAEDLEVLEPAPADPFGIPTIAIADLNGFSRRNASCHRVRVSGVVTYRDHRLLVVQDRSGGVDLESEVAADVAVGDSVDVVGFPDGQPGFMSLSQALVRKGGTNALPSPVSISADDLYSGRGQARVVRISGELLGETMEDGNPVLEIRSKPWIFRAKLLKGPVRLSSMPIGSQLQVTGVPLAGRRFSGGNGGKAEVGSLEILLRTADDVVVQQWPPWWVWEHATIIIGALALVVVGAMLWIRYLRLKVARRTEELKVAMTELERQTKTSATLEERNRLAREIHDGLEQGLSAIMMQLDGLESQIGSDPADVARHLELARKMVRFSRTEVRHSLFDWKSPALVGRNLGDALAGIARQMSAGSEPRVTVQVSGKVIPLPAAIEHHLLRMAQEALNNALKYSRASLIQIELAYEDGRVRLAVRDDGRGFDAAAILNGSDGHFGLQNLRSRARKLGGAVEIESAPGKGTRIEATVPVSKPDTDTDLELM